jgi:hypothetical protein
MNTIKQLRSFSAAMLLLTSSALGAVYHDSTGDMFPTTASFTHCDITSVVITNDATNITFTIFLAGDPIATSWGEYNIGIDSIPGAGQTNGTAVPNRPITMSVGGMDYWIRSWDTGAELYHWAGSFWYGDWQTYNPPSDIQVPVKTTNSVTLTTTLASLNLSVGQTFNFDVYTCGGTGTDSAWDALANPNPTLASGNYTNAYDSGTNVYQYTVTGPVLTNAFGAAYSDTAADLLPTTASWTHCDIVAFDITNDATNISFKFYLTGDPIATSWGEYNIGIDSIPGGATNGTVPPNRPITMSVGGMDYWIRSWDTGAELYHWAGTFWFGDWQTYNPPSDLQLPVKTTNSVTLTTTLASLGLTAGQTFKFDAYTCGGTGTDSAVDALANPGPTAASGNYVAPYDSGTNVFLYTVKSNVPTSPLLSQAQHSGTTFTVNLSTQSGFNYILEYKNLLTDATWTAVQTNSGTGGQITMTNSGAATTQGFYRVHVQ